jgi:hypothetical protein
MKTQDDKFWIVWSPTGAKPPRHRHLTFADAMGEAERLAVANPGHEFFALGAEASVCSVEMHRVEYIDRIPF